MGRNLEKIGQPLADEIYRKRIEPNRENSCRQFDVELGSYRIEEKFRDQDWGDLLVEIIQYMEDQSRYNFLGWFYEVDAEFLFYHILEKDEDGEWFIKHTYMIDFPDFKKWFVRHMAETKGWRIKTVVSPRGGGVTLNLAIKWGEISPEIFVSL